MLFYLLSKADLLGNLNLNRLLPMLAGRHDVRVFLSDSQAPAERDSRLAASFTRRLRDYPLERFFPALDAAGGGAGRPGLLTFAGLSRTYGIAIRNLGAEPGPALGALEAALAEEPPGVILCCRHDFILSERLYSRARHGAYNTHSGMLPYYRGPFCVFWTMLNGERETACSLHVLKPKVDTGDIVALGKVAVDYGASLLWNMANVYHAGLDGFEELVPELERGRLRGLPQDLGAGRYYPEPDAGAWRRFAAAGLTFSDDAEYRTLLRRYLPPGREWPASLPDFGDGERDCGRDGRGLP